MCKFLLELVVISALTAALIHGQDDQSGFISIDCGIADGSHYTDPTTGINYDSDSGFIDSGLSKSISATYQSNSLEKQLLNLRSFPQGTRNCYTLRPSLGKGNKYLIRTWFMYGNYDSRGEPPVFDLYLGAHLWGTVTLNNGSAQVRKEIVHIPSSDYINICLVKTGLTTPFISALELRPLNSTMYKSENNKSLVLIERVNFDSSSELIRYKDDVYDRLWRPTTLPNCTTLSTMFSVYSDDKFRPPSAVMRTAIIPISANDSISYTWKSDNIKDVFYLCLHLAELQVLQTNQRRQFNIFVNGDDWEKGFSPRYLNPYTSFSSDIYTLSGRSKYVVTLNRTENSTLPPIINALEVYLEKDFSSSETDERDVASILSIKSAYRLTRNWQGDPCTPRAFRWDGLSCRHDGVPSPRITSLNLSFSGLSGLIAPRISSLTMLQVLDLSNNSLTGKVPEFLAELDSLKVLNLKGNNFSGTIPDQLQKKSGLSISIDYPSNKTDTDACHSPCKKKRKFLIPVVASVLGTSFVLLIVLITLWMILRRRKRGRVTSKAGANFNRPNDAFGIKNHQFTCSEVLEITNNFQVVIGRGGFGTVYHGFVGDTQVAVKMLSPSSSQGYKEFIAEAKLLMSVHHRNLTSFIGYCNESNAMGIIYEYMANGDLEKQLSDRNPYILSLENRLKIAIDAAQGLEYLHNGCKPAIIHRDVKSANILLDENFQAKLADFGISRAFISEDNTHVSTDIVGTIGYLDPEYYSSRRLSEKSDVYSFGIVLLEIVTGHRAVSKSNEKTHLIQWIREMLPGGDIGSIVDPRLQGEFVANSAWKVIELAIACISRDSVRRPTMTYVVAELKQCLLEMTDHKTQSRDSVEMMPTKLESRFDPEAR